MRRGAESFLHRWSRRKQANQRPAALIDSRETVRPDALAGPAGPPANPPAASPPEPLPRLEDLTAESDLAAFLRKGVPDALKNAALRKMWSLDPAIRDHVGLAECAWDFNRPESIPGFGPLTKAAAPVFLSRSTSAGFAAPNVAPSSLRGAEKPADAGAPAGGPDAATPVQEGVAGETDLESVATPPALAHGTAACRHGSALPRSRAER